jgi:hypothetical protein
MGALVVLAAAAAGFFFFCRMYRADLKALRGFIASYDRFDAAMPAEAAQDRPEGPGAERAALGDLRARSSLKISSLIKNDGELMAAARETAELAQKEFESLLAYDAGLAARAEEKGAVGADEAGREYRVLRTKRQAAFSRFMRLGDPEGRDDLRIGRDRDGS